MADTTADDLPRIDFITFVLSLSHSVLVYLGQAPTLAGTPEPANLPLARQTIDLLGVLEEKTKGNLSGEEERVLSQTLYDLRLRYAEMKKT